MVILKPTAVIVLVVSGAVMTILHLPVKIHLKTQCDAPSAQVTTLQTTGDAQFIKKLQQR